MTIAVQASNITCAAVMPEDAHLSGALPGEARGNVDDNTAASCHQHHVNPGDAVKHSLETGIKALKEG